MIIKLKDVKLKDLNIIEKAATLIRDKFKIGLIIAQCSREINTTDPLIKACSPAYFAYLGVEPELKIELTVSKDHKYYSIDDMDVRWIAPDDGNCEPERMTLEYVVYDKDLKDGSLVDELIGGDLSKQAPDMRQTLRLAFILYDGIRYATTGTWKIKYADKGWLPKVTNIQRQSYMTKS